MGKDSFGSKKGQSTDTFHTVKIDDTKTCPHCGKPVISAGKFCSNCGKPLDGDAAPEITTSSHATSASSHRVSPTSTPTYTPEPTAQYDALGSGYDPLETPLSTSPMQPMPPAQQPRKKGKGKVILVLILVLLAAAGGGALTWAVMSGRIALPWIQSTGATIEPSTQSENVEKEPTLDIAQPSSGNDAGSGEVSAQPSVTDDAKDEGSKSTGTETDATTNAKDGTSDLESQNDDASSANTNTESALVGTWTGTLSEKYSWDDQCNGAKEKPIVLTVHSVDKHDRMKVDVKVCYHNHKTNTKPIESSPDDVYLEFKDQEVLLKDRKFSLIKNVSEYGDNSTVTIDVVFEGNDSATAKVTGRGQCDSEDRFVVYKE